MYVWWDTYSGEMEWEVFMYYTTKYYIYVVQVQSISVSELNPPMRFFFSLLFEVWKRERFMDCLFWTLLVCLMPESLFKIYKPNLSCYFWGMCFFTYWVKIFMKSQIWWKKGQIYLKTKKKPSFRITAEIGDICWPVAWKYWGFVE